MRSESIRADLPAGPVDLRSGSRAVEPARSDLVRLTLTGTQLTALLEQALALSDGPTVHLAGAQVRYDPRAPAGQAGPRRRAAGRPEAQAPTPSNARHRRCRPPEGAGGLSPLAGLQYQRAGLLDVEAVAAFLRRLPQPVEVAPAAASSPPDRERGHASLRQRGPGGRRSRAPMSAARSARTTPRSRPRPRRAPPLVTDARGIEVPLDGRSAAGSILRVVVRARRGDPGRRC